MGWLWLASVGCDDAVEDGTGGSGANANGGAGAVGGAATGGAAQGGASSTGGSGGGTPITACGTPMPRISDGAAAFGSTGDASQANDGAPNTAWHASVPGWLAYDLSSAPASERGEVVVAWYAIHTGGYLNELASPQSSRPIDYAIEINAAAGGSDAPTSGWVEVASVTDNTRSARQHAIDLAGANWVRIVIGKATDPEVGIDLDVHHAPRGASDAWLLMGDSITFMSTMYAFSDLPARVTDIDGGHPIVIDAAIGGTNTGSAADTIDAALAEFPGCYVALAYGTNDHADSFGPQMESLIQRVLAAGKLPVIPRMPWSFGSAEGEAINAQIEMLYTQHPEVIRGPDLWATFEGRTDLIPQGDVHPNGAGMEALRQAWAETIAGVTP